MITSTSFFDLYFVFLRMFTGLLTSLGVRRRRKPWGTVYDSVTKQPLDPVYVVLQDLEGNEIQTCITDLDGRYGFLVGPGKYKIVAHKTNYKFPSEKLRGKTSDEVYSDLYFGEEIEIKEYGEVLIKNIPMDPINFDWNTLINLKGTKTIEKLDQSTTFGIFCTYEKGYITKSIKANVYIPNPLKVEIKANDQSERVFVYYNSGVTLSWNTENAEKCEASSLPEVENWKGEIPLSGKRSITNITKDTKFSIKCSNKYQTMEKYVEVKVIFGGGGGGRIGVTASTGGDTSITTTLPSISVNLKVNNQEGPINANQGDSVTLSWQATNANSCTVSASPYYSEWSGFKEPQGSINITLTKSGTTTFSISCVDENGNDAVDQVIVYVNEITLTKFVDLKVNGSDNAKVVKGSSVNVKWNSYGVNSCTVSSSPYLQEWSGVKPPTGEAIIGPISFIDLSSSRVAFIRSSIVLNLSASI